MIRGIDCSRYQGTIDWAQVFAAGYRFAVLRATVGNYYMDPMFETNWDGAKAAGLKVGAYHVIRTDNTPESQLSKLRGVLDGNDPRLVVLDCEVSPEGMSQSEIERAHYWMIRKTREFYSPKGTETWIYSAKWWWDPNIGKQDWVLEDGYPFWVAAYGDNNEEQDNEPDWAEVPTKLMPVNWKTYDAHQFTSRGKVPGIVGNVDLDIMRDFAFSRLWGETPPPGDKVPVEIRVPAGKVDVKVIEV